MIENAANFTRTFQIKPSIFEVLAQKSLNETLYPALQKVVFFLSAKFPEKLGFLDAFYDEAFLALSGLLQFYYLKNYGELLLDSIREASRFFQMGLSLKTSTA